MRRDFFGPDGDTTWNLERLRRITTPVHASRPRHPRRARRCSRWSRRLRPDARHPLRGAAVARPGEGPPVRRLRRERRRHPEPARGGAPQLSRVAVRLHEHEQGVRRRAQRAAAASSSTRAGTTRGPRTATASTRPAASTPRCTACSARPRSPPTSWCRSTGATSACRPSASAAAASPARTTRAPSCTASSPIWPAPCARAARTASTATRGSRCATTSTRSTSVSAFLAFYERPRVAAVYNLGGGRENSVSMLEAIARFEELLGKRLAVEYVDEHRVGRPHLLHQRPAPPADRLPRLVRHALARRHPDRDRAGGRRPPLTGLSAG